jgi:hypothetical protein
MHAILRGAVGAALIGLLGAHDVVAAQASLGALLRDRWQGGAELADRTIVIEDGKIASVGPSAAAPPADATVFDLPGHTVIAGFGDLREIELLVEAGSSTPQAGTGYDSAALLQSVRGRYGEY